MATLRGTSGASLVGDFGATLGAGFEAGNVRRREVEAQTDLESKLKDVLGLGGPSSQVVDNAALGRLGQLSPQMAQAVGQARQNPQASAELREQAEKGLTLSQELQKLPDHAARLKRLAAEAGTQAAEGGDLTRLVKLSNLSEGELDLELQRMQLIGKDVITSLPPTATSAFAALIADNPQVGTALLGRRDTQISNERARRAAAAKAQADAAARARAAAGPQGPLAEGLAEIQHNFERGFITEADRDARQTRLRSETTADPGDAAGLDLEATIANIAQTRLENDVLAAKLGDPTSDLSAKEQQIQRTMKDQGVTRQVAQALTDGIYKVGSNPVTGLPTITNQATGTVITPTDITEELPPFLPEGFVPPTDTVVNPDRAFGAQGFGINAINTIVGAISNIQVDPATDEAIQAIDNLNTRTLLTLAAEFPGRPSNLTREKIEELTASPANVFTGRARALVKMEQMRDLIGQSISAAVNVSSGQGNFSATDRGEASKALLQLSPLWTDYDNLIKSLTGDEVISNIVNQAEYDALPSGSKYILPNGTTGVKK